MFKKIQEFLIKDINESRFDFLGVYNGRCFWVEKEGVFTYKNELRELIHIENLVNYFLIGGKYLYVADKNPNCKRNLINIMDLDVTSFTKDVELSSGNENIIVGIDQVTSDTVALSLETFSILWRKKGKYYFEHFDGFTFSRWPNEIALYNNSTGNEIWQLSSFSKFDYKVKVFTSEPSEHRRAELLRILGVYKNVVWLKLNSGRLLGLSTTNGELLYNITHPNYFPLGSLDHTDIESGFLGYYTHLDRQTGMLFGLHRHYYWEIDLDNPEESFILYNITYSAEKYGIEADSNISFPFTNNEIFFNSKYPDKNGIGVFDRNKKEIVWAAPVERSSRGFPAVKKMDYADNKFYVLTDNGNLIIYERQ